MKRNALAWAAIALSTVALISSRGVTRAVPAALQISPEGQKQARALGEAFNAVAEYVKPSVVQITVEKKVRLDGVLTPRNRVDPHGEIPQELQDQLRQFYNGQNPKFQKEQYGAGRGTGSGFIYDDKGHILTNNHVVEGADRITVQFYDGEEMKATVVGTDPKSDVAVIKVETTTYRPLLKGKSSAAKVGDWVLAVGSPFGFDQTVTSGIISAVGRNDAQILGLGAYEDFLQTDAAINPGNSGGPLVDLDGKVIGINSAIATESKSNSGIGFAIPIDMAANLADRLIKDGKVTRALLGIGLQQMTPVLARQFGLDPKLKALIVKEVLPGSPAEKAGLQSGDVVLNFNGTPATNREAFRNFVSTSEIGKEYTLTYLHEGNEKTTKVVLAAADELIAQAEQPARKAGRRPEPKKAEQTAFGLEVQELTASLANRLGFEDDSQGLVITEVEPGSSADANGLEVGMLITKILKDKKVTPITSFKQFQDLTSKADELTIHATSATGVGRFYTLQKPGK